MEERIYKDSNTLVEFNPIRSTITVDVSGCGDCYSFYYWNLPKVLRLFTRRYVQCRDINHGEDFKYSNLKDKPIGFLKYLCKKHKIEL